MSITLVATEERSVLVTNPSERRQATELVEALQGHPERLVVEGAPNHKALPADLASIINKVVQVMAAGGTITIGSLPEELSTTVAAEQLGVSRPTLMKMIHAGELPAHKVGSHHRLKAADVLAAKRSRLERQRQAFDELRELEDELEKF
jgi:excisionase family DNA binding protein